MKWRSVLLGFVQAMLLLLVWSGPAYADPLAERLAHYPDWQTKPPAQPANGDLIYPDWFAGHWTVTTTLLDLTAPLAPAITTPGFDGNRDYLNKPVTFDVRFIEAPTKARGIILPLPLPGRQQEPFRQQGRQIVSDRAFNGLSLAKAYLGDRAVRAVKVDPTNPNRQITLLKSSASAEPSRDRQLVSTVIARATEAPDPNQFITTEVFRQEFRGTSQLYFNEVENTTAYWKQTDDTLNTPKIIADQVTAIYLSPKDPDYFEAGDRPVALYRYQMELVKQQR